MMTVEPDGPNFAVKSYFNYLNRENYFLKASGKIKGKDFGGSCVGCTFKIMKTELSGDKHPEVCNLLLILRDPEIRSFSYATDAPICVFRFG